MRDTARDIPLAVLRVLDLARALAVEPDVLLLDEMTAALPANLAEKVLEVVRRQGDSGRSVIFISHRFVEISALCDRATVLRDGETVGVVDIVPGVEEKIVELMLGARIVKTQMAARAAGQAASMAASPSASRRPQSARRHQAPRRLLRPRQWRGRGRRRARRTRPGRAFCRPCRTRSVPRAARSKSTARPVNSLTRATPFAPASPMCRATAPRRSPCSARCARTLRCPSARHCATGDRSGMKERTAVAGAIARLQIDTRAQGEVQRLSGGNQQKVTIARWIAANARTILCFDPTRGIDVGTKQEIYKLLRELAGHGQVGALLHLRTGRGAACLRPRHRHLRRPCRRHLPGRGGRRAGADACRLRPAARRHRRCRHPRRPDVETFETRRRRLDPLLPQPGLGRRPVRPLRAAVRPHQAHPAGLWQRRFRLAGARRAALSPSPSPPRPSSSSPAASTFRSPP